MHSRPLRSLTVVRRLVSAANVARVQIERRVGKTRSGLECARSSRNDEPAAKRPEPAGASESACQIRAFEHGGARAEGRRSPFVRLHLDLTTRLHGKLTKPDRRN